MVYMEFNAKQGWKFESLCRFVDDPAAQLLSKVPVRAGSNLI